MTFDEATESLRAFVLIDDIAKALDCSTGEVRKMRSFHNDGGSISAPYGMGCRPSRACETAGSTFEQLG